MSISKGDFVPRNIQRPYFTSYGYCHTVYLNLDIIMKLRDGLYTRTLHIVTDGSQTKYSDIPLIVTAYRLMKVIKR